MEKDFYLYKFTTLRSAVDKVLMSYDEELKTVVFMDRAIMVYVLILLLTIPFLVVIMPDIKGRLRLVIKWLLPLVIIVPAVLYPLSPYKDVPNSEEFKGIYMKKVSKEIDKIPELEAKVVKAEKTKLHSTYTIQYADGKEDTIKTESTNINKGDTIVFKVKPLGIPKDLQDHEMRKLYKEIGVTLQEKYEREDGTYEGINGVYVLEDIR